MTGSKTWMQLAAVAVIAGSVTAMGQNGKLGKTPGTGEGVDSSGVAPWSRGW